MLLHKHLGFDGPVIRVQMLVSYSGKLSWVKTREFRCIASFRESFIREFLYVRAHAWGSFGKVLFANCSTSSKSQYSKHLCLPKIWLEMDY